MSGFKDRRNFRPVNVIRFETENITLPSLDFDSVRNWIVEVARIHGYAVGRLSYLFCDDNYILQANNQFLGHDYFTDIITFDYTRFFDKPDAEGMIGKINGDMIISLDTVMTNAQSIGEDYSKELLRVIIHGVLHLCGINDKGPGEREIMEQNENEALGILPEQLKNF